MQNSDRRQSSVFPRINILTCCSFAVSCLILIYFYFSVPMFGGKTVWRIWTEVQEVFDDQIPYLLPGLTCFLLWMTRKQILNAPRQMNYKGALVAVFGVLCFVVSYRTMQPKLGIGSFPFVVVGTLLFYFGWQFAKWFIVPAAIQWATSVPLAGISSGLQIISTNLANSLVGLFGVETYAQGTNIYSANGNWDAFHIAGGCGGMNSLVALLLISGTWTYLSHMKPWKKLTLFFSAVPLAIIGNAFRLTSIFLAADYVDPKFAATTWHDWSGILIFFPFSLLMLFVIQSLLVGESLGFLKKKTIVRSSGTHAIQQEGESTK